MLITFQLNDQTYQLCLVNGLTVSQFFERLRLQQLPMRCQLPTADHLTGLIRQARQPQHWQDLLQQVIAGEIKFVA